MEGCGRRLEPGSPWPDLSSCATLASTSRRGSWRVDLGRRSARQPRGHLEVLGGRHQPEWRPGKDQFEPGHQGRAYVEAVVRVDGERPSWRPGHDSAVSRSKEFAADRLAAAAVGAGAMTSALSKLAPEPGVGGADKRAGVSL